jgi:cystine transport system substrate-binding protein
MSSGWRLTAGGKFLLFLVGAGILGYAAWQYRGSMPAMSTSSSSPASNTPASEPANTPASTSTAGSTAASGGVLARMKSSGTMRVGMEPDAPPLHFTNDKRQEEGFDFRVAGEVAQRLGIAKVQVVEADYEDLPELARTGKVDLVMGGYVPDPSIEGIEWSQGYLDFGLCLIVSEGLAWQIKQPSDLAGKVVAIYDDPAAERWVRSNIPNAQIRKFSGDNGWFEAVESGQASALVYDYPFAATEIKEHPRTVIVKHNLNSSKYAIGVPARNYDLMYEVNKALEELKGSPTYPALMREYLTSTSEVFMKPIAGQKSYVVKAGDTLSTIAQRELNNRDRWQDIWKLNTDRVANPDLIYPRLVLLMP